MFRSIATAAIALTLVGCSGDTTSGSSWNAMEGPWYYGDQAKKYGITGKAKGAPGFAKAESYVRRSPKDWELYSKYRDQVYVANRLGRNVAGRAFSGWAPADFMAINARTLKKNPWWSAGTLVHEALHLEYPDMPHNEVHLRTAAASRRMGAPSWVINGRLKYALQYSRDPISRDGVVACADEAHDHSAEEH